MGFLDKLATGLKRTFCSKKMDRIDELKEYGNSADLPWLGSTKDDIARMQSEKAGREKRERSKEGHPS